MNLSFKVLMELTKPRLVLMALLTVFISYALGVQGPWNWPVITAVLIGAGLVGGGANALNQALEHEFDAKMKRTSLRPIPQRQVSVGWAYTFGILLNVAGHAMIWIWAGFMPALMAFLTLVTYVCVYTPTKRFTTWNTFIGAVPGALPTWIGWTASGAALDAKALSLFALLFFWQLPHFFAIAWLCRDDYERAGFKMISCRDANAQRTCGYVILWTPALFLSSFFPVFSGLSGSLYFLSAFIAGIFFLAVALYAGSNQMKHARGLMIASIVYLAVINIFLLFDKL